MITRKTTALFVKNWIGREPTEAEVTEAYGWTSGFHRRDQLGPVNAVIKGMNSVRGADNQYPAPTQDEIRDKKLMAILWGEYVPAPPIAAKQKQTA